MCGRFSFSPLAKIIEDRFDVKVDSAYKPRFNSAPSQNLAVISNQDPEHLSYYRWGLIPFWSKDPKIGNRMINAKAETITEKPSFKNCFKRKRCLVLSDGFFEWKKINAKEKIPYRILMRDENLFAMAGIWDTWKDPDGELINSFSILTISPNALMENIHHRMPVILNPNDEKKWLAETPEEELKDLLKPYPAEYMTAYPVSKLVNSPTKDSPEILEQVNDNF
ncbi:MAG: SOS response-associated peptidase [Bacteroidales bacterium]|nr:SOS response-associated peptidase [Bacteroidales bacterium]MCF8403174.1 SOS response-associated peptidase [Bacteroidales bacterium]